MDKPLRSKTSTIDIYIKLAQYPILARTIRARMREEIFRRGVISQQKFEAEIEEKAVDSQKREGVYDPFVQEPAGIWQERKERIREYQTDFYFGRSPGNRWRGSGLVYATLKSYPGRTVATVALTQTLSNQWC